MNKELKVQLKKVYEKFFRDFGINKKTGLTGEFPDKRFACYPYIGSNYGKSTKILIVGLDIGADGEGIISFQKRNSSIEKKDLYNHNPHIAGTYFTALYFLKKKLGWENNWNKIKNFQTCQKILKEQKELLPEENPLSYISLTNFHKFVSVNRGDRAGSQDRKHFKKEIELGFFIDEVKVFNPDIIVCQSTGFEKKKETLLKTGKRVFVGPHPSYRGKRKREPEYFLKQIKEINC